jgi:hypothetical protein
MAENCYNTILFQGDRVAECLEFIKSRMTGNRYDGIYLIDGKQEKSCFDLTIEDGVVDFITEGTPDIYQVDQLALKFGLDYRYDYVDADFLYNVPLLIWDADSLFANLTSSLTESKLFGCVISDGGGMSVVYLEQEDFNRIDYDKETDIYWIKDYDKQTDVYSWRDVEYESLLEVLDILLEEKIKLN